MKKILLLFFTLFLSYSLYGQNDNKICNHFIVIGVDGMSPDGIQNVETPNIDDLIKNGAYTFKARAVLPTSSSTNWASMMMGAGPEQHGITSNGWEPDDFILPPVVAGTEGIFPTIFSVIKSQDNNSELAAIYHWGGFGRLFEKSYVDYDVNGANEKETTKLAVEYIKSKKPLYTFIHLDHVDGAGHGAGHGTKEYYKSVSSADSLIGNIVRATKDAGIFDNTIILVTADHGGIGYGHGGETIDEMEIPFILSGKGIKKNHIIKHPIYTYDNSSTVLFALGFSQPYAWIGRAVKSAFVGYPEPKVMNEKVMLPSPTIFPKRNFYDPAGGIFIDKEAIIKIETEIENAEIRYTLDGTQPTQNSLLYEKPVKLEQSAVVLSKIFLGENEESYSSTAFFRIAESSSNKGIEYQYYELDKSPSSLPTFESLKPLKTGKTFEFRIGNINNRKDAFAIRYIGKIEILKSGEYKFYTNSDDGSKLYINGKEVVDNDGDHGTKERSGTIKLDKGLQDIFVEYFNGGGGSWLDVYYKGPGIPKQIIPPDVLVTSH